MKKHYQKPSMKVYFLQPHSSLLVVSNVDPNSPFNWGNPNNDR